MRIFVPMGLIAVGLAAVWSCTPSQTTYSGTSGMCTYKSGQSSICTYYTYSGMLTTDPNLTAATAAAQACSSNPNAIYDGNRTCDPNGAVGFCTVSESLTQDGETFTFSGITVWPAGMEASYVQGLCQGTWTTFKP